MNPNGSQTLHNVTAVILAGGRGTRLRSVVFDRPKVLAEVNGKPFLAYLLDQVATAGVKNVVLCIGYLGSQIQSAFGQEYGEMRLAYSQETTLLGTGGALRLSLPLVESEDFVVMNGDSFCDVNFPDMWSFHHENQANATLALTSKSDTKRYGRVSLSSEGIINGFEEKKSTSGAGWINAGIYVLNTGLVQSIPAGDVVSLEYDVFPRWVGKRLFGYPSCGHFLDIGTPESYVQADALFARNGKK